MVLSQQIQPGMTLSLDGKIYRVESVVKVTAAKGNPFIKVKMRDLTSQEITEKNFKVDQNVKDVSLQERHLEFLYPEGKEYLFLDINTLDQVHIPARIIADTVNYLKEGIGLLAACYGDTVFSVELPQFLELMVAKVDEHKDKGTNGTKVAVLETGAKIEVPLFIEIGDIIKVDPRNNEYIQRV